MYVRSRERTNWERDAFRNIVVKSKYRRRCAAPRRVARSQPLVAETTKSGRQAAGNDDIIPFRPELPFIADERRVKAIVKTRVDDRKSRPTFLVGKELDKTNRPYVRIVEIRERERTREFARGTRRATF